MITPLTYGAAKLAFFTFSNRNALDTMYLIRAFPICQPPFSALSTRGAHVQKLSAAFFQQTMATPVGQTLP